MSIRPCTWSGRGLAMAAALGLALALLAPAPASAASVRLQVWDFNACDQFGRSFPDCQVTPTQRASAITQSVTASPANVVTLQELCRSTFDMVVAGLPPGWVGSFFSTFTTTDTRCQSADPTWGIAVLARSATIGPPSTTTLGVEASGERRTLLCVDVTVAIGIRTCTTHLTSSSQSGAAGQAKTAVG